MFVSCLTLHEMGDIVVMGPRQRTFVGLMICQALKEQERDWMVQFFKGRNLTHIGCALGVCIGLMAGLIAGALISRSSSLSVAIWVMLGTVLGVGLLGWVVGAVVSPKGKKEGS